MKPEGQDEQGYFLHVDGQLCRQDEDGLVQILANADSIPDRGRREYWAWLLRRGLDYGREASFRCGHSGFEIGSPFSGYFAPLTPKDQTVDSSEPRQAVAHIRGPSP
jgi:hypothetical protein